VTPSLRDGMAETERLSLTYVVDVREVGRVLDELEPPGVVLGPEQCLEFLIAIEVILQRSLAAPRHEEQVVQPGLDRFLHHVLDGRLVDHRQHFLRGGLGGREESSPHAGNRHDRFCHLHVPEPTA